MCLQLCIKSFHLQYITNSITLYVCKNKLSDPLSHYDYEAAALQSNIASYFIRKVQINCQWWNCYRGFSTQRLPFYLNSMPPGRNPLGILAPLHMVRKQATPFCIPAIAKLQSDNIKWEKNSCKNTGNLHHFAFIYLCHLLMSPIAVPRHKSAFTLSPTCHALVPTIKFAFNQAAIL